MTKNILSHRDRCILRQREVSSRTGLSRSDLYNLQAKGLFPHSVKIAGLRISGWDSEKVEKWIDQQLEKVSVQ